MVVVSLMMVSTIEYPKFRSSSVVVIGSLLIFLTLLPQNFSVLIANIPAKLLFMVSLIYLITVPFMGLYSKLRRSGPNVR
jgi:archaetidylserine synthase